MSYWWSIEFFPEVPAVVRLYVADLAYAAPRKWMAFAVPPVRS